jgi:phospholipid/cholesterol/gamma-HCH transport system ATP-binding protein
MASDPIIRVRDLVARYGERTILSGVSFDVRRGEICAVLGGSGCGKSTLLKCIVRLLDPVEGSIEVDGEEITRATGEQLARVRRKMGVLFQTGALFGSMTLAENVALPLEEYTDLSPPLIRTLVRFKLALVGLAGFEHYMPAELSGGMRKRAAIARAMALDPQILLFDEMSAGLDPVTSAELDRLVLEMNRSLGLTIVIVTHELPSIEAIVDHAIMLDEGRVIADGAPAELKRSADPAVHAFFNRESRSVAAAGGGDRWRRYFDATPSQGAR